MQLCSLDFVYNVATCVILNCYIGGTEQSILVTSLLHAFLQLWSFYRFLLCPVNSFNDAKYLLSSCLYHLRFLTFPVDAEQLLALTWCNIMCGGHALRRQRQVSAKMCCSLGCLDAVEVRKLTQDPLGLLRHTARHAVPMCCHRHPRFGWIISLQNFKQQQYFSGQVFNIVYCFVTIIVVYCIIRLFTWLPIPWKIRIHGNYLTFSLFQYAIVLSHNCLVLGIDYKHTAIRTR